MAEAEEKSEATPSATKLVSFWRRFSIKRLFGMRMLATIAVCSLVLNVAGYGFIRARMLRSPPPPPSPEITLGAYQFQGESPGRSGIVSARFTLHVSLLKEAEKAGRAQLGDAKFRIQQDVEELLRRAHGDDFEDPTLAELKRQMQEQVNATLGMRAVSNVIITDLAVRRAQPPATEAGDTAPLPQAADGASNVGPEDVVPRQPKPAG